MSPLFIRELEMSVVGFPEIATRLRQGFGGQIPGLQSCCIRFLLPTTYYLLLTSLRQ